MDNKQSLSPDLKQIYDSIMNTPVKPSANSSTPANGQSINTPASTPSSTPPSTPVIPPSEMSNATEVASPAEPPTSVSPTPTPSQPITKPTPLPSVAPRQDVNTSSTPFVFSTNQNVKKPAPTQSQNTTPHVPRSTPKLLFLLIPLGIIFLAVYAVFWMALFGLVDLSQFGL